MDTLEFPSVRDDELLIRRSFAAPASLVFLIWSRREHMMRWLGPKDFTCTHLDLDFREGGAYRACIRSEAYGDSWFGGRLLQIEPNRKIVMTFAWDEGSGRDLETTITVTFQEREGRTLQTFHQRPFSSVEVRDSHIGGWSECFEREQAYAERLAQGGQP
ncbi:SRPBCC domain-containing protein [Phenylobacterium terrae]|uniref:SRPBCC domain-containing protein n=1 Tax=Phenylobacterium terrae TaxID=2665495 RepID=A0ABW4MXL6_9CAUL